MWTRFCCPRTSSLRATRWPSLASAFDDPSDGGEDSKRSWHRIFALPSHQVPPMHFPTEPSSYVLLAVQSVEDKRWRLAIGKPDSIHPRAHAGSPSKVASPAPAASCGLRQSSG